MTRTLYRVDVARVVITGARAGRWDAAELRALAEQAVAGEAARAPLPAGRAVCGSLRIDLTSPATPGGVAGAVAMGVARAMRGGGDHG